MAGRPGCWIPDAEHRPWQAPSQGHEVQLNEPTLRGESMLVSTYISLWRKLILGMKEREHIKIF